MHRHKLGLRLIHIVREQRDDVFLGFRRLYSLREALGDCGHHVLPPSQPRSSRCMSALYLERQLGTHWARGGVLPDEGARVVLTRQCTGAPTRVTYL